MWNVVSPMASTGRRKHPVRVPVGQRVGDTGASEGRPVMGRIGLMPNPKGCPLPVGKDSREGRERQHYWVSTGQ
jgi:hypothetical protein